MSRRGVSEGKWTQDNYHINRPLPKTIYKDRTNRTNADQKWTKLTQSEKLKQNISAGAQSPSTLIPQTRLSGVSRFEKQNEEEYKNTSNKLFHANFCHHDPNICVCDDCSCGRHLCKLHAIVPDMSKTSVYRQSFQKTKQIPCVAIRPSDALKNTAPYLDLSSIQRKDFSVRPADETSRPRPEDLLKTGGFSSMLTTYGSGFPGFIGSNQYIKPTDSIVRGNFPLQSSTTYGKSFTHRPSRATSLEKTPDNLKQRALWFGSTNYGESFVAPNPESYTTKVKRNQKIHPEIRYNHQYETVYKNDFLNQQSSVCTAKKILESRIKGGLADKKSKFSENTDFKALSPDYHALSMSKQTFV